MLGRDELVLDDDRVVDVAADRRDRVEGERGALLRLAGRRCDDDEPAELGPGLAGRRPKVADERSGDPEEEQVEERRGTASRTTQTVRRNGSISRLRAVGPVAPRRDPPRAGSVGSGSRSPRRSGRRPDPDPVALAEGDRLDPPVVDERAVRAAEIRQDQRAAPRVDPGVVARRPSVAKDEAVVGRPADRQRPPVELDRPARVDRAGSRGSWPAARRRPGSDENGGAIGRRAAGAGAEAAPSAAAVIGSGRGAVAGGRDGRSAALVGSPASRRIAGVDGDVADRDRADRRGARRSAGRAGCSRGLGRRRGRRRRGSRRAGRRGPERGRGPPEQGGRRTDAGRSSGRRRGSGPPSIARSSRRWTWIGRIPVRNSRADWRSKSRSRNRSTAARASHVGGGV